MNQSSAVGSTSGPAADWLASGGAYAVIFGQTVASVIVFAFIAIRIGKSASAEGDGCLLAIANFVLALLGAGIGFFSASYPQFVFTSLIGTITFPLIATWFFSQKIRRGGR
jgi:uncharacterized membrane protein